MGENQVSGPWESVGPKSKGLLPYNKASFSVKRIHVCYHEDYLMIKANDNTTARSHSTASIRPMAASYGI